MQTSTARLQLALVTLILLVIAASRIPRLRTFEMDTDEVWSVFQSVGTPKQIVAWTPFNWPPAYYLAVGGWRSFVGIHPKIIRLLSVFVFLIGAALVYRVTPKVLALESS